MFAFPMVDGDSARLELRWGTTIVPLMIRPASWAVAVRSDCGTAWARGHKTERHRKQSNGGWCQSQARQNRM